MTKSELRIRNWVKHTNESGTFNIQIKELREMEAVVSDDSDRGWNFDYDAIEPIPLTEEILLKSGFSDKHYKKGHIGIDVKYENSTTTDFVLEEPKFMGEWDEYYTFELPSHKFVEVKHVHDLQNLFFILTGKELETKIQ